MTRNEWYFDYQDPTMDRCKVKFKKEFYLLLHRANSRNSSQMREWLETLM